MLETNATLAKVALMEDEYRLSAIEGIVIELKHLLNVEFESCKINVGKHNWNKVGHNVAVFRCKRVFGLGMVWNGLALSIIFWVG
jgi:hypothetical protein